MFSYLTTGPICLPDFFKVVCDLIVPTKMIQTKKDISQKFASFLLVLIYKSGNITAVFDLHRFRANLGRNAGLYVAKVDHVSVC